MEDSFGVASDFNNIPKQYPSKRKTKLEANDVLAVMTFRDILRTGNLSNQLSWQPSPISGGLCDSWAQIKSHPLVKNFAGNSSKLLKNCTFHNFLFTFTLLFTHTNDGTTKSNLDSKLR
jgi:hypothetical protein